MSFKKEIREFAQVLYNQYDSDGKRSYSLRKIEAEILEKYTQKVSFRNIKKWADKYEWDEINAKIKQQAILKAETGFTTAEQVVEAETDKLAKDYKNAENLANIGLNVILAAYKENPKNINIRDALAAIKTGTDIKFRIQDIPESDTFNKLTDSDREDIIKKLKNG